MGWIQFEKCKTCESWKDSYDGCYLHRGGFCDDHEKAYRPLYSMVEAENKELEAKNKELVSMLERFVPDSKTVQWERREIEARDLLAKLKEQGHFVKMAQF